MPLIQLDWSDARNRAARATSSGVPSRRIGAGQSRLAGASSANGSVIQFRRCISLLGLLDLWPTGERFVKLAGFLQEAGTRRSVVFAAPHGRPSVLGHGFRLSRAAEQFRADDHAPRRYANVLIESTARPHLEADAAIHAHLFESHGQKSFNACR